MTIQSVEPEQTGSGDGVIWLRSPNDINNNNAFVGGSGGGDDNNNVNNSLAVRPDLFPSLKRGSRRSPSVPEQRNPVPVLPESRWIGGDTPDRATGRTKRCRQ